jgi:hypothetical protein
MGPLAVSPTQMLQIRSDMDDMEGCYEAAENEILKPSEPNKAKIMAMIQRRNLLLSMSEEDPLL